MEFLWELIFEIFLEGIIEIIKNKKISKWIRYPLLAIISLIYLFIILLLFFISIQMMKNSLLLFVVLFILSLLVLIFFICFLKKLYLGKMTEF